MLTVLAVITVKCFSLTSWLYSYTLGQGLTTLPKPNGKDVPMEETTTTGIPERKEMFKLRVLAEYDDNYQIYVAQCLETGSIVSADDMETLQSMMFELLTDEVSYAVEHKNFANLFSTPAPPDVWVRWLKSTGEVTTEIIPIDAKELRLDDEEQEVLAGVQVSRAA